MLARGTRLSELLKQPQFKPYPVEEQVVTIFAGVRGYLDKIEVGQIGRFEHGLIAEIRAKHAGVLDAIRTSGEISTKTEDQLKGILEAYAKTFA